MVAACQQVVEGPETIFSTCLKYLSKSKLFQTEGTAVVGRARLLFFQMAAMSKRNNGHVTNNSLRGRSCVMCQNSSVARKEHRVVTYSLRRLGKALDSREGS
jgi:hypothetical protein